MALRVLIVDDEALARSRLRSLLADCTSPGALVVGEVANAADAMQFVTHHAVADVRLFLLAAILGVTGWAQLARLLRAETLKLGELDYVQAARAFGVSNSGIMRRHILPNLTHIIVIVSVLDFSGLVLYDCLLYTSPSPRDRTRSRMPSSA